MEKIKQRQVENLAEDLAKKVDDNDPRLSDARAPTAHQHPATDITGLAAVATSGSYTDLLNVPPPVEGYTDAQADARADVRIAVQKGQPNGLASLDGVGRVPAAQLPSYVDDVLDYPSTGSFPATGESGKIYIATDTNAQYRWTGSFYAQMVASPGSTDAVPEGSVNKYFTDARAVAAARAAGVGDVADWVAGPQRKGQLSLSAGQVWRAKTAIANSATPPEGNPNNYAPVGGSMTPAEIKQAYESNPDTNAFTDAERDKLANLSILTYSVLSLNSFNEGENFEYISDALERSGMDGLRLNGRYFSYTRQVDADNLAGYEFLDLQGANLNLGDKTFPLARITQDGYITGGILKAASFLPSRIRSAELNNAKLQPNGQTTTLDSVPVTGNTPGTWTIGPGRIILRGSTTILPGLMADYIQRAGTNLYDGPDGVIVQDERGSSTSSGPASPTTLIYDVPAAKRNSVVQADAPAVLETDSAYLGKVFVDEVTEAPSIRRYTCDQSAQADGSTVLKWFRHVIL